MTQVLVGRQLIQSDLRADGIMRLHGFTWALCVDSSTIASAIKDAAKHHAQHKYLMLPGFPNDPRVPLTQSILW